MQNLYNLNFRLDAFLTALDENPTGELTPELILEQEVLQGDVSEALEQLVKWIRNLDAESSILRGEANPFINRARVKEVRKDQVRAALKLLMEKTQILKTKVGPFALSIRNGPQPRVEIDPSLIDLSDMAAFEKLYPHLVRTEKTLNKTAIQELTEEDLPKGITLVRGTYVHITER